MTLNRKPTGVASTIPGGLVWGVMTEVVICILGTGVTAKLVDMQKMKWEKIGYAVLVILLISAWMGSAVAAGRIKRRKILVCMMSGTLYFIILIAASALFFGGTYSGVGETAILIFCGSMLAVFSCCGHQRKKVSRKRMHTTVKLNK